jgi:hypothetical protein
MLVYKVASRFFYKCVQSFFNDLLNQSFLWRTDNVLRFVHVLRMCLEGVWKCFKVVLKAVLSVLINVRGVLVC